MKITLIQPAKPKPMSVEAEEHWQLTRPFSLFFLASSLEQKTEYEVQIIDMEQKKYENKSLEEIFRNDNSQIFGITATTYTRFEAIWVAKYIKKLHPDSLVVVGGVHFMYTPEDTLQRVPEIDIVVRGEGETTIVELANAVNQGIGFEEILGITYRKNNQIISNPDQAIFEDLDNLPIYTNFSWNEYPESLFGYPEPIRALSIMSSRGCPNRCIFCSKAGMKYRLRNPKNVVDEIEIFKEKFGIEGINFIDLTFTVNPLHVQAICQEMINRDINLKWWCESRANAPLELLPLMKRAGCASVAVGIESGSPRILSRVSKDIPIDQAVRFCQKCSNLGIFVDAYFMFSHPDETEEDVKRTLDLIDKLENFPNVTCAFQPTMIFPGTELEKIAHSKGILPSDFSWCDPYQCYLNIELEQLSNIPLYIDKLSPDKLRKFIKQRKLKQTVNSITNMKFRDLVLKGFDSLVKRKPSSCYIFSPSFYYTYIRTKLNRYGSNALVCNSEMTEKEE